MNQYQLDLSASFVLGMTLGFLLAVVLIRQFGMSYAHHIN